MATRLGNDNSSDINRVSNISNISVFTIVVLCSKAHFTLTELSIILEDWPNFLFRQLINLQRRPTKYKSRNNCQFNFNLIIAILIKLKKKNISKIRFYLN